MPSPNDVHELARVCKHFLTRYQAVENSTLDMSELDVPAFIVEHKARKAISYLIALRAMEGKDDATSKEPPF